MNPNDLETQTPPPQPELAPAARRLQMMINSNLVPGENPEFFAALVRDYEDALQPSTGMERRLMDNIVNAAWRNYRLTVLETYLMHWQMKLQAEMHPGSDDHDNIISAYHYLADSSRALQVIAMNQSRNRHDLHQATRLFLDLRARLPRRRATASQHNEMEGMKS